MKGLAIFIFLWNGLCLFVIYELPEGFDSKNRLNLGVIIWLIGALLGFYYLVARKWRNRYLFLQPKQFIFN